MTANELLKKALNMLGYESSQSIQSKALEYINAVCSDLFYAQNDTGFMPITKMSDNITQFGERTLNDVIPYGVASWLAMSEDDAEQQQIYARMYNLKRIKLCGATEIEDTLPIPN